MNSLNLCCVYILMVIENSLSTVVNAMPTYDMEYMKPNEILHLENRDTVAGRILYWNDGNRTLEVISFTNKNLLFKIENVYAETGDYLIIYDGQITSRFIDNPVLVNLTGRYVPDTYYFTKREAATFVFHQTRNCSFCRPPTFKIMFTVARPGPICLDDEFLCSDGHCISNTLQCDSVHNCGEYTDTDSMCNKDMIMIMALVGAGLSLLVIVMSICVIVCCRQRQTQGRILREQRSRPPHHRQVRYSNRLGNPGVFIDPPAYEDLTDIDPDKLDGPQCPPPYTIPDDSNDTYVPPENPKEPPPPYTELGTT